MGEGEGGREREEGKGEILSQRKERVGRVERRRGFIERIYSYCT